MGYRRYSITWRLFVVDAHIFGPCSVTCCRSELMSNQGLDAWRFTSYVPLTASDSLTDAAHSGVPSLVIYLLDRVGADTDRGMFVQSKQLHKHAPESDCDGYTHHCWAKIIIEAKLRSVKRIRISTNIHDIKVNELLSAEICHDATHHAWYLLWNCLCARWWNLLWCRKRQPRNFLMMSMPHFPSVVNYSKSRQDVDECLTSHLIGKGPSVCFAREVTFVIPLWSIMSRNVAPSTYFDCVLSRFHYTFSWFSPTLSSYH